MEMKKKKIENEKHNKEETKIEEVKPKIKMKLRPFEIVLMVVVATIVGVVGGTFTTCLYWNKAMADYNKQADINKELEDFSQVYESIINNYYKDIDSKDLTQAAIQGMLSSLNDPYAAYMTEAEKVQFDERMQGEYTGIGVELITAPDKTVTITDVFDNTPAQKAGIKIGDIITKVDGKSTSDMTATDLATYIKSSSHNTFDFEIKRGNQTISVNIRKQRVELKSVISRVIEKNHKKVGYIQVTIFASNTYDQFRREVLSLESKNVSSIIIDVRDNAGGYLFVAEEMLSMFMRQGSILYQLESKTATIKTYDKTEEYKTYPVAILINKDSASASEILAAAFKENYGSKVIGETSYGKGTVQETQDMDKGAMIKFTIQKWLTPNGEWIDGKGETPTNTVKLSSDYTNNPSEANDNQLQTTLNLLTK